MNVKQLRNLLEGVPDHVDVFIRQTNDEFDNSLAVTAGIKPIRFSDGVVSATDDCFVLSDDI